MVEKIKAVGNPLTIIAIFAALAEVAGTVALGLVEPDQEKIFIWFVMLFPTLLVLLFFITLNWNPSVLYSPSDFRDEENFLEVQKGRRKIAGELDEIRARVAELGDQLGEAAQASDLQKVSKSIDELKSISEQLADTREDVEHFAPKWSWSNAPNKSIFGVLWYLSRHKGATADVIAKHFGVSRRTIYRHINTLREQGFVIDADETNGGYDLKSV